MTAPGAAIAEILPPAVAGQLGRFRLGGRRRFTQRSQGEHLAGRGGQSIEFHDFRDYRAGDDLRSVDWHAFARLRRPYVKIYRQEEEQHLLILLDASASMGFAAKLQQAIRLAALFAIPALAGGERVACCVGGGADGRPRFCRPQRGSGALARVLAPVTGLAAGGAPDLDALVDGALRQHRGRGVVLLLSDFLHEADPRRAINRLQSAGLECFAVQILAAAERDPDLDGDWRLVDCETGAERDLSAAGTLWQLYHQQLQALQHRLASLTASCGGRYACVDDDADPALLLRDTFIRQGWLR